MKSIFARARGLKGRREFALTKAQICLAKAALANRAALAPKFAMTLASAPSRSSITSNPQANCAKIGNGCWRRDEVI
ncbi:MAG: hypothetical protein AAGD13_24275 [Pseudomonadota bacterium]